MMKCDAIVLADLLDTDDTETHAPEVTDHLEHCTACQTHLANLAANDEQWDAAQHWLSTSGTVDGEYAESIEARERWKRSVAWNDALAQSLLSAASHPEMLGRIGRYDVERLIGSGGMGMVFKAYDTELNRPVAVKLLAPYLASSGSARSRFAREARAAAAVVDDHVVPIHNVETDDEHPFLVMKYIAGGSLQQRLDREGPLDACEVLRIGMHTAKGLAAAHAQGLIHRDVKPSNILLDEGVDRALLTDFGLARAIDDASLTRSGFHPGTPHYMSPEQVRGEAIDARSDLFGLGCVLYALCTGHPPFRSENSYAVLRRITEDTPRPIRETNANVPLWLDAIVMKLLSKSRDDRFVSAAHVAELLTKCLSHLTAPVTNPVPRISSHPSLLERNIKTMNENESQMKRSKAPAVTFWTIGLAVFFASFVLASRGTETVANWYWGSLGVLYGTLLYFSGLTALYVAYRKFWNSDGSTQVASTIPFVSLPALIGLIGSVHGYISIHHSISSFGAAINQTEMSSAYVTVLTSFFVGLCFSIVATVLIAIATMIESQRAIFQTNSD